MATTSLQCEDEVDSQCEQLARLYQTELDDLAKSREQLETDNRTLTQKVTTLEKQLVRERTSVEYLEGNLQQLKIENITLQNKIFSLEKRKVESLDCASLVTRLDHVTASKLQLEFDLEVQKDQYKSLEVEFEHLQRQLHEQRDTNLQLFDHVFDGGKIVFSKMEKEYEELFNQVLAAEKEHIEKWKSEFGSMDSSPSSPSRNDMLAKFNEVGNEVKAGIVVGISIVGVLFKDAMNVLARAWPFVVRFAEGVARNLPVMLRVAEDFLKKPACRKLIKKWMDGDEISWTSVKELGWEFFTLCLELAPLLLKLVDCINK